MKLPLFFLFLIILFSTSACSKKGGKKEEALPTKFVQVEEGPMYLEISATGAVKPQVGAQVKVGARISGRVEKLFVKQGDYVKAGQLIAIIEHADLQREVEKNYQEYLQAQAQHEKIKRTYPEKIKAQKMVISAIKAELAQLKREKERLLVLYQEGLISKNDLERIERDVEVKENQLASELAKLSALEEEYNQELKRTQALVLSTKNQYEASKVKLSYAFIYSPINGYVSEVSTQQGETIVAGLNAPTFITVIDLSKLEVHCYIDETDIGKIKPGMPARFRVDSFPDKIFEAKVRTIYPGAIIRNNVVFYNTVLDILTPYEGYLRPEMTAQVTIIADKKEKALQIPARAIKVDEKGKRFVYVKRGDKVEKQYITTGWESQGKVEVLSGLSKTDLVGIW
ncbi:MAG: efflux RND transporter periplasmic adaptor subunit [Thermodesulfobacteriaceae bacterium]|jgi:HlyD family secretion protein/macrolide-specific efflux system membrane fusion protein